jgi:hypothetical protein
MQATQLFHDQKQKKAFGKGGIQKILPVLQQAYGSQGNSLNVHPMPGL